MENSKGKSKKNKKKSKSAKKQLKIKTKGTPNQTKIQAKTSNLDQVTEQSKSFNKDIHIPNFTMPRPGGGPELLSETDIQLTFQRKYGLIGRNGFGKTTLLTHLSSGKIPEIPQHLRILHIKQEIPSSSTSVLSTVLESDQERTALLEEEKILCSNQTESKADHSIRLKQIYDRLESLEASTANSRASKILFGLGIDENLLHTATKDLSGGWRMRVALACALFASPDLLLLDEPTNHLDFPAVEWLTNYLLDYDKTLLVVSHDRKFLNDVCTDIAHIEDRKIKYYKGDYDTFERVRTEQRKQAKSAYDKQKATIEHNEDFIRRFRANKKLSSLAQSRMKIIAGMEKLEDVKDDYKFRFRFPKPSSLKKEEYLLIEEMAFGYSDEFLFSRVNLRVENGAIVGILGRNGTGKSTLVQLALRKLAPREGRVVLNSSAVVGYFSQHHAETLDLNMSPYELLHERFPESKHQEIYRKLGQFNLAECARQKIGILSGGEKSRLSFAVLTWNEPHLLIMDEPTNHLDLDTIDGLIEAIRKFEGAVLVISHDEHFLTSVCNEYWAIGPHKTIKTFHDFNKGKRFSYSL